MKLPGGLICLAGSYLFLIRNYRHLSVSLNKSDSIDSLIKELQQCKICMKNYATI